MNGVILIVDDEPAIRKLISTYLTEAGYECHDVEDAKSAKLALQTVEFDLLLTDLKMPGDSGLDLIRFAKANFPHVGRVMITGYSSPDIASEIMAIGVYGYVIKPLSRNIVLVTVANALHHLRLDRHMHACKMELERKISHRSEKLKAIMDNLNVGVIMYDSNMHILELNRRMKRWFPNIEDGKNTLCYHAFIGAEQNEKCKECPVAESLESGQSREVAKLIRTEEGVKEFRIATSPIRNQSGEVYAVIGLYDDITEKMIMERDLRQAQKLEAVGQLAAGIAHEINTPIQYIGDNIHFFKDAFGDIAEVVDTYDRLWQQLVERGAIPEEMNREMAEVKENADLEYLWEEMPTTVSQSLEGVTRVNRIARAMKDFSHPGDEEMTPVDINKILETTITVCRNEWKYVAGMETDFASALPLIPCLPSEISQVFLNIIVNAAHAIEEVANEGIRDLGAISVSTHETEAGIQVRIGDTGGGVPAKIQKRIFDPFFTTKERGRGTGQGLAIAYRTVVEKHQGELYFETAEGVGTTFFINLPKTHEN